MKIAATLVVPIAMACAVQAQELTTEDLYDGLTPVVVELAPGDPAAVHWLWLRPEAERLLFERVAAGDPAYARLDDHGVVVIRPAAAARDPQDPLNRRVAGISWTDLTPPEIISRVVHLAWPWNPDHAPRTMDTTKISIALRSGTLMDILVAAARAHGRATWAVLPHQHESVVHYCVSYRPVSEIVDQYKRPGMFIPMGTHCPSPPPGASR